MAIRFKPIEGTGPSQEFARDLRELVVAAVEAADGPKTVGDFAKRAGMSPARLSAALNGKSLPRGDVLRQIIREAEGSIEEWEQRRLDALDAAKAGSSVPMVDLIRECWRVWEAPAPDAPDYRSFSRLFPEAQLVEAFASARAGDLASESDDIWAYLVISAVQHGNSYRQWFELARAAQAEVAVVEGLIETVVRPHRSPRWRAAWLLQLAEFPLRSLAIDVGREMPAASGPDASLVSRLFEAVLANSVEGLLAEMSDVDLDPGLRRKLQYEFFSSAKTNAARGLIRGRLEMTRPLDSESR